MHQVSLYVDDDASSYTEGDEEGEANETGPEASGVDEEAVTSSGDHPSPSNEVGPRSSRAGTKAPTFLQFSEIVTDLDDPPSPAIDHKKRNVIQS
ncbi:unnamed protein product [Dibothriocephalus latus]|uniref:Uncharacterized protein n=1 Tax=Dibothriocephalus latus TaxID=60516 RepID=A0A3P7MB21_DIBLA|nr:unnamed protein product [Dibothriocephalus latus]